MRWSLPTARLAGHGKGIPGGHCVFEGTVVGSNDACSSDSPAPCVAGT